jgi:hypothetical protein
LICFVTSILDSNFKYQFKSQFKNPFKNLKNALIPERPFLHLFRWDVVDVGFPTCLGQKSRSLEFVVKARGEKKLSLSPKGALSSQG